MKILNIFYDAMEIIKQHYGELYGVTVNETFFRNRMEEWYVNTDISNPVILAAMAIHGDYTVYEKDEIIQITRDIFPYLSSIGGI